MAAVRSSAVLVVLVLLLASAESAHHASAPAPAADCSSVVMDMADCLSFVSSDGKASKPEKACCTGLKKVLKTDAKCLCEAFKTSASLGVSINVTKALTLPAACDIRTPPISNCGLSLAPAGAPGASPAATAGAPESGVLPPAAAPGNSAVSVQQVPVLLAAGVLLALAMMF